MSAGGEWSTSQVLLHLIAVEEDVWQWRLRQMAAQDDPFWVWTEPNLAGRGADLKLDSLVATFAKRRAETLAFLGELNDPGWARIGTHAVFGVLDVAGLVREAVKHDEEHLADLERRANG